MSDLGFSWNTPKTVQKQTPERVIVNERMSSKQVVQNPNRVSLEQIVAALCVCVGELCEVVEAQAKAEAAKLEITKQSLTGGPDGRDQEPKPRRTRTRTTEPTA